MPETEPDTWIVMLSDAISSVEPTMCAGAFDQSVVALRSDVLVFATPPARP
jgi:hypothetical protein